MNAKKHEQITIVLFCGFLAGMMILYLILPKLDFSTNEKRYLAEPPLLNWENVSTGDWGNDVETYMADHIPGRDFFVGLNAYFELLTGRQVSKDIWYSGNRLIEAPVDQNETAIAKNMNAVNNFSEIIGQPVDLMIVPSAGWAMELTDYQDAKIIDHIYSTADTAVRTIDLASIFNNNPEYYFKTDHHWNSTGAYAAYQAYMESLGRDFLPDSVFEKEICGTFQGSTYSRSALWLTPAEDLEIWKSGSNLTVTNGESDTHHEGVFYYDRLKEADKYTVFLDGNHSIVRIHNPSAEGKLLVIRDSYSNSLGCFLAESYAETVLVDLRYYKQPISELVTSENFDDILICYSIGNFMTDANIIWLR